MFGSHSCQLEMKMKEMFQYLIEIQLDMKFILFLLPCMGCKGSLVRIQSSRLD